MTDRPTEWHLEVAKIEGMMKRRKIRMVWYPPERPRHLHSRTHTYTHTGIHVSFNFSTSVSTTLFDTPLLGLVESGSYPEWSECRPNWYKQKVENQIPVQNHNFVSGSGSFSFQVARVDEAWPKSLTRGRSVKGNSADGVITTNQLGRWQHHAPVWQLPLRLCRRRPQRMYIYDRNAKRFARSSFLYLHYCTTCIHVQLNINYNTNNLLFSSNTEGNTGNSIACTLTVLSIYLAKFYGKSAMCLKNAESNKNVSYRKQIARQHS